MAKSVSEYRGVKITIISDRMSALGYFNFDGKQYKNKIKNQIVTPDDIEEMGKGAVDKIEELLNQPVI